MSLHQFQGTDIDAMPELQLPATTSTVDQTAAPATFAGTPSSKGLSAASVLRIQPPSLAMDASSLVGLGGAATPEEDDFEAATVFDARGLEELIVDRFTPNMATKLEQPQSATAAMATWAEGDKDEALAAVSAPMEVPLAASPIHFAPSPRRSSSTSPRSSPCFDFEASIRRESVSTAAALSKSSIFGNAAGQGLHDEDEWLDASEAASTPASFPSSSSFASAPPPGSSLDSASSVPAVVAAASLLLDNEGDARRASTTAHAAQALQRMAEARARQHSATQAMSCSHLLLPSGDDQFEYEFLDNE